MKTLCMVCIKGVNETFKSLPFAAFLEHGKRHLIMAETASTLFHLGSEALYEAGV